MEYIIGSSCHPGVERENEPNQDSISITIPDIFHRQPPLIIVADGMGGQAGGQIASKLVVEIVANQYRKTRNKNYLDTLNNCLIKAHSAIRKNAFKNSENLSQMGSTAVIAILAGDALHIANVGDSRAYLINYAGITQLSWDHSFVADLVRAGEITSEDARNHPDINRLSMAISARREYIEPFLNTYQINSEDIVLLCSDGLWGTLTEKQIWRIALELPPQLAADKLTQLTNVCGGPDNISVIIARHVTNIFDREKLIILSEVEHQNIVTGEGVWQEKSS